MSLLRYGYHGVYALRVAMNQELTNLYWKKYVADMILLQVRPKYETELPSFDEYISPKPKEKPMTTDQIIDGVLDKLDQIAG